MGLVSSINQVNPTRPQQAQWVHTILQHWHRDFDQGSFAFCSLYRATPIKPRKSAPRLKHPVNVACCDATCVVPRRTSPASASPFVIRANHRRPGADQDLVKRICHRADAKALLDPNSIGLPQSPPQFPARAA